MNVQKLTVLLVLITINQDVKCFVTRWKLEKSKRFVDFDLHTMLTKSVKMIFK